MKEWEFRVYVDHTGYSDINMWIKNLAPKAKTRMRAIISYLEITKIWSKPYFYPLTGKDYQGIYEIRFIHNNIQYRPLGCYGPTDKTFTLLFGAREKGDRLKPINAPEIATERMKLVLKHGKRYTDEYI